MNAVLYADLVDATASVAATPKRSEKVRLLAEVLRSTPPEEVATVVGLLVGQPRQGRIGVGWATLRDARVAPAAHPSVTVADVDRAIDVVAATSGAGSQRDRERVLVDLLGRSTEAEQEHLVRTLTGQVRQGANDGVVTDAVAKASGASLAAVRRATMLLGDLGVAAARAMNGESLDVGLTPLIAVQPMLAATSESAAEAVAATGPASVEWKLDGIRVQAHKSGDDVRLFTRGLNDITSSLPTVEAAVRALPADQLVLDGESLAFTDDGRPRRFQDTMSGLGGTSAFFFDVLLVDGRSIIDEPLSARRAVLRDVLPAGLAAARRSRPMTASWPIASRPRRWPLDTKVWS